MADVPVMVPKTDADVEKLVAATLQWAADNYVRDQFPEAEVRRQVDWARTHRAPYYRAFTFEEMHQSSRRYGG